LHFTVAKKFANFKTNFLTLKKKQATFGLMPIIMFADGS